MKAIIFDNSGRLRSGWRAAIFFVAFVLIAFAAIGATLAVLSQFPIDESVAAPLRLTIPFAISTAIALGLGWLCGRFFEGVPFRALGASLTKSWYGHLAAGLAIGAVSFLIALIMAVSSGGMSLSLNRLSESGDIAKTLLGALVVFAVGAASEETLFRGYLLQTFSRANLKWFGIMLTGLLFAVAHGANPGVDLLSSINTVIAGIWFGIAYLKTRDLWFPFGIHLMWNWLQGPVFGINVSGISGFAANPLMRAADNGPAWLTGGNYGIEGGAACTFALILAIGIIWLMPGIKPDEDMLALSKPPAS